MYIHCHCHICVLIFTIKYLCPMSYLPSIHVFSLFLLQRIWVLTKTPFLDVKEEMIFLFCHLRCSLVPTISDMKSLISSLAICSNTSVVGPDKNDQVQAALIVSCIISTIALNKKFKPFEEPTPVTVPLFISSKILSRRTKMFKEKFVNSETLHVTIHDFQKKSFNKILRCSKISKPLAKSFEVNNYF